MSDNKFAPKSFPIRPPTSNQQKQGSIYNPPRYSNLGGLNNGKAIFDADRNQFPLVKPGGGKKII